MPAECDLNSLPTHQQATGTMMPQRLSYLQLCRLPTVFTAMADIFLGYLLVHEAILSGDGRVTEFLLLLGASSCLYLSGMVWNDVFDREVDAVERPARPIPSGRIPVRHAQQFGGLLMLVGVGLAAAASARSLLVAGLLVAAILMYDKTLKRTGLGPLAMGSCRFLNVLLGASTVPGPSVLAVPASTVWVAMGLGTYIVGVTWFARTEARLSQRGHLVGAMLLVNVGLATLAGWVVHQPGVERSSVLLALAIVALTINRRLAAAVTLPTPERVQPAIRTMLLSIIVLDATLIAHRLGADGIGYALATVLLLVPAITFGRWIRLT